MKGCFLPAVCEGSSQCSPEAEGLSSRLCERELLARALYC